MPRMKQEDRDYFGYYGELNIQFKINNGAVNFYETPQPVDNVAVFPTFEEARTASIIAFEEYQKSVIALLEENSKKVLEITEDEVFGYNPGGGW